MICLETCENCSTSQGDITVRWNVTKWLLRTVEFQGMFPPSMKSIPRPIVTNGWTNGQGYPVHTGHCVDRIQLCILLSLFGFVMGCHRSVLMISSRVTSVVFYGSVLVSWCAKNQHILTAPAHLLTAPEDL